ncbi:hypothetical protein BCR44DRAFT_1530050, partial [Catenaria anguillulae PL171]
AHASTPPGVGVSGAGAGAHRHLHDDTATPVNHTPPQSSHRLPPPPHKHPIRHLQLPCPPSASSLTSPTRTVASTSPYRTQAPQRQSPAREALCRKGQRGPVRRDRLQVQSRLPPARRAVDRGHVLLLPDTKSSSGTFINNVRVSPANTESQPIQLKDGDIIQLGVDYQGRTEDIFRCVRMRVELNREAFKHRNNAFRNQVIRALRALAAQVTRIPQARAIVVLPGRHCPFQALFIAPCCHSFHFKCARPLLQGWPNFNCPLCRHFADLSVSVSIEDLSMLVIDDGTGSPVESHEPHHHASATSPTSPPTARHDDNAHSTMPATAAAVAAPAPTSSRTSNLLDPASAAGNSNSTSGVHFALNSPPLNGHNQATRLRRSPQGSSLLGVQTLGSPGLQLSGATAPSSADAAGALTPVAATISASDKRHPAAPVPPRPRRPARHARRISAHPRTETRPHSVCRWRRPWAQTRRLLRRSMETSRPRDRVSPIM